MTQSDSRTLWIAATAERFFLLPPGPPPSGKSWLWSMQGECCAGDLNQLSRFEVDESEARALFRAKLLRGFEIAFGDETTKELYKRVPRLNQALDEIGVDSVDHPADGDAVIAAMLDRDVEWVLENPDETERLMGELVTDLQAMVPPVKSGGGAETMSPEVGPLVDIIERWWGSVPEDRLENPILEKSVNETVSELWPWSADTMKADIHRLRSTLSQLTKDLGSDPSTVAGRRKMQEEIRQSAADRIAEDTKDWKAPTFNYADLLKGSE